MNSRSHSQGDQQEGGEEKNGKMVRRSISVPLPLWQEARRKADLGSLSAVIQKFLRLWVADRINLDDYEED